MKEFKLSKEYSIICESEGTRYGFRHIAVLLYNGNEIDRHKACYYNRTWEQYPFESIIKELVHKHFGNDTKDYEKSIKYREIMEIINKLNNGITVL